VNRMLDGLRVVEGAAFVAAPLCGMTLAQQGADVIRFDPLGGGLDARRWPITAEGRSLYWAGLNKGKRSIAVDTHTPQGRQLMVDLITAPGEGSGIFLTNFPATGWLGYEALSARRPDLIMMSLSGNSDGTTAVDYTLNCAVGLPFVTGPEHGGHPVNPMNHVLPAWDAITGVTAAMGILAAERARRLTGRGDHVQLPLADVAFAMMGNLGYIAEVQVNEVERRSYGNYLYGSYGCEFETADGRYLYLVALTHRQWDALREVTGLGEKFDALEPLMDVELDREGDRFTAREAITALLHPWFRKRTLAEVEQAFRGTHVCWGPYQTFHQMVQDDWRCSTANPMFSMVEQPGMGSYLVPGSPLGFSGSPRRPAVRAPQLGEHTDQVLHDVLGLSDGEIGGLRDRHVVGGPIDVS